jgi:ferritin-like metal-binding protein YciE
MERLEAIFENLEEEPEGKACKGMAGVIAEGKEAMEDIEDDDVKDAALIGAAQKVEHYEIALYGTLKTFASMLDEQEAAGLLEQTLDEEKETDHLLTGLSEEINARAEGEGVIEVEKQPMRRSSGRSQSSSQNQRQAKASSRRKRS